MTEPIRAVPEPPTRGSRLVAAVLALAAGAAGGGSFLVWTRARLDIAGRISTTSAAGYQSLDGKFAAGAAVLLLAAAVAVLAARRRDLRFVAALLALLAALVPLGFGTFDLLAQERTARAELRAKLDRELPEGLDIDALMRFVKLDVTPGVGLYLVTAGGAVGLIGAIGGLVGAARRGSPSPAAVRQPPPPPPPHDPLDWRGSHADPDAPADDP